MQVRAAEEAAKSDATLQGKLPKRGFDTDKGKRDGWKLSHFEKLPEVTNAGMIKPEVAGIRLYTGTRSLPAHVSSIPTHASAFACFFQATRLRPRCGRLAGPMYVQYNETLRKKKRGAFVTTLHAINSGIIKLCKQTKKAKVFRGVSGGNANTAGTLRGSGGAVAARGADAASARRAGDVADAAGPGPMPRSSSKRSATEAGLSLSRAGSWPAA